LIKINFKKSNIDRLANANDQINQLNAENEEKRKLISRLEADIINFQIDNRGCVNTIEDEKLIGHDSSLSEILSEDINDNEKDENLKGNVLKIVISQRDRLKSRYDEIHNELTICKENNILLKHELEKTQEDNVNLYGKIKFLQSYNNKNNQVFQVKDSNVIDIEARYESDYERHLDPFRKFHIQEGKRKYAQLRPHDKAALSLVCKIIFYIFRFLAEYGKYTLDILINCSIVFAVTLVPSKSYKWKLNND
uniref:Protein CASP n=1 Tax=Dracunculus medinensis TaxID=318479 RepID=A0A0N4UQE4_DRAME